MIVLYNRGSYELQKSYSSTREYLYGCTAKPKQRTPAITKTKYKKCSNRVRLSCSLLRSWRLLLLLLVVVAGAAVVAGDDVDVDGDDDDDDVELIRK